ncbi:TatD-related deoxyribonuclease [Candidatus Koribacter versatilis Ellin345]|uniref:TatD-related deoxyribonuclease n=1 Tax=Koribacter versatilis (strain Ellin345) TaxID=204669 RepID=Q1IQ20_KORVE|nr:TatD family hydrolase [Candidatus Koribacter versatilis]ABF41030.1 TatD-related deoxyribonuclease [Candidatus Koribacter versatilis Ellin345]
MFVDSHCHLDGPRFAEDREAVILNACNAGVEHLLLIGNGDGPDTADQALQLAKQYDWMHATIGVHPHEAKLATAENLQKLAEQARDPKVVAWGEIGLDYWYDHSPRDVQQRVFVEQLELAKHLDLPIVIHCRPSQKSDGDAWEDLFALLTAHWVGRRGVMHCFTGTIEQARQSLDIGFLLSFAGNVTFPKAQNIRDAAVLCPLDAMLIETDSPYLAPVPHRGKRNEPAFVAETAAYIAQLKGAGAEELGRATTSNFYRFFGIQKQNL